MNISDEAIIRALKFGRVPARGTLRLAVGRDLEIAEFGRVLDYVSGGYGEVRFLRGDYGAGKTFMCSAIREISFDKKFAVSIVNLNREIPFGKRELVVRELILGLRRPEVPTEPALGAYLEKWANKFDLSKDLDQNLVDSIARISAHDPSFASGLRAWVRSYVAGEEALMESAQAWMRGDVIEASARAALKVVGRVGAESAFRRWRAVVALVIETGCSGVSVLIDEAESIMRLNAPQRMAAYFAIREMIDICETDFPRCLFVFAGTQPLFEDPMRGIAEYAALYDRIRPQQSSSQRDIRQPILRLEELDEDALIAVATRIRDIHASAYGWKAQESMPEASLKSYIITAAAKFGSVRSKPRAFLKGLVDVLDANQQGVANVNIDAILTDAQAIELQDADLESNGFVLAGT